MLDVAYGDAKRYRLVSSLLPLLGAALSPLTVFASEFDDDVHCCCYANAILLTMMSCRQH